MMSPVSLAATSYSRIRPLPPSALWCAGGPQTHLSLEPAHQVAHDDGAIIGSLAPQTDTLKVPAGLFNRPLESLSYAA